MKRNKNYILFIMGRWEKETEIISEVIEVLSPITEEFNDTLTGWYFDLTINDAFRYSACNIPITL